MYAQSVSAKTDDGAGRPVTNPAGAGTLVEIDAVIEITDSDLRNSTLVDENLWFNPLPRRKEEFPMATSVKEMMAAANSVVPKITQDEARKLPHKSKQR